MGCWLELEFQCLSSGRLSLRGQGTKVPGMYFDAEVVEGPGEGCCGRPQSSKYLEVATLKEQNLEGCRKNGVPCLSEAIKAGLEKVEGRKGNGPAGQGQAGQVWPRRQGWQAQTLLHGPLPATGQPPPGADTIAWSTLEPQRVSCSW